MDTAGEEDYQTMVDEWIKAAEGFLLLFAINDKESFKALEDKYKRIEKQLYNFYWNQLEHLFHNI